MAVTNHNVVVVRIYLLQCLGDLVVINKETLALTEAGVVSVFAFGLLVEAVVAIHPKDNAVNVPAAWLVSLSTPQDTN